MRPPTSEGDYSRLLGPEILVAPAILGLMAIVAAAARWPLSRSAPVDAASARAPGLALGTLLIGTGLVAGGVVATWLFQRPARKRDEPPQRVPPPLQIHWPWKLLALALPVALGAALVAAALLGTRPADTHPPVVGAPGLARPELAPTSSPSGPHYSVQAWLPWTLLAIVAVALLALLLVRLRERRSATVDDARADAARAAVGSAIDALDTRADARSAVIAAYVAMESTLAEHGVARRAAEAPREYLRRVLGVSDDAARAAVALTGLFEEARFSTRPVTERVRVRALLALDSLRIAITDDATWR